MTGSHSYVLMRTIFNREGGTMSLDKDLNASTAVAVLKTPLVGATSDSSAVIPTPQILAYRIDDAAKVVGLSRSTLYQLMGAHKLRSVMVAGRRLIPADALRDLLQGAA
jgi:excisionase family DNA binding protein